MPTFTVYCYDTTSGRVAWSTSQEATDALAATAQACLAPSDRQAFLDANGLAGYADDFAEMEHPLSEGYIVHAEVPAVTFKRPKLWDAAFVVSRIMSEAAMSDTQRWTLDPRIVDAATRLPNGDFERIIEVIGAQWPHESEAFPGRIAYTRDANDRTRDKQTVARAGAYINRVFVGADGKPLFTGREVELLVSGEKESTSYAILTDLDAMIRAIRSVPSGSCMGGAKFADDAFHPMRVYDPALGWGLAVRYEAGEPVGRAIVQVKDKGWVRSYCSQGNDDVLQDWLKADGYARLDSWEGYDLARIDTEYGDIVAPYLDGSMRRVNVGAKVLSIDSDGDREADSTNGLLNEEGVLCADGEIRSEDDVVYLDGGPDGEGYYHEEDVRIVDGEHVHVDYVAYNDIERCHIMAEAAVEVWVLYAGRWRSSTTHCDRAVLAYDSRWILDSQSVEVTHGPSAGDYAHESQVIVFTNGTVVLKEAYGAKARMVAREDCGVVPGFRRANWGALWAAKRRKAAEQEALKLVVEEAHAEALAEQSFREQGVVVKVGERLRHALGYADDFVVKGFGTRCVTAGSPAVSVILAEGRYMAQWDLRHWLHEDGSPLVLVRLPQIDMRVRATKYTENPSCPVPMGTWGTIIERDLEDSRAGAVHGTAVVRWDNGTKDWYPIREDGCCTFFDTMNMEEVAQRVQEDIATMTQRWRDEGFLYFMGA